MRAALLSLAVLASFGCGDDGSPDDTDAAANDGPDLSVGGNDLAGGDLASSLDLGADGGIAQVLAGIPSLVFCQPGADPFVHKMEMSPTITRYQACVATCVDWAACTTPTTARGRDQLELAFVVDEDGAGNGFGGTLRFTKDGSRDHVVMFHKGGAGTAYVDDDLPEKVEAAGGTYIEPKWVEEVDTKVGWFSRPFAGSTLEKNLYGVSKRPAAVMKWIYLQLAKQPFSTAGCSGGSIATYYPRHWHAADALLRYQLLSGGPVMSKIEAGCGATQKLKGRCTIDPTIECVASSQCGTGGGTCSPYAWRRPDVIMTAVRGTIDHLHAAATNGSTDCSDGNPQPAYDASDYDAPGHAVDWQNDHRIDFMTNVGATGADDYLNVVASGAAVYSGLTGPKTWTAQTTGVHCDSFKTDAACQLLKAGAGL